MCPVYHPCPPHDRMANEPLHGEKTCDLVHGTFREDAYNTAHRLASYHWQIHRHTCRHTHRHRHTYTDTSTGCQMTHSSLTLSKPTSYLQSSPTRREIHKRQNSRRWCETISPSPTQLHCGHDRSFINWISCCQACQQSSTVSAQTSQTNQQVVVQRGCYCKFTKQSGATWRTLITLIMLSMNATES